MPTLLLSRSGVVSNFPRLCLKQIGGEVVGLASFSDPESDFQYFLPAQASVVRSRGDTRSLGKPEPTCDTIA